MGIGSLKIQSMPTPNFKDEILTLGLTFKFKV